MSRTVVGWMPPPVLVVELSLPPAKLSPNRLRRLAPMARHRLAKPYREAAGWAFRHAADGLRLEKAVERTTFYWPDKRRRDADNAAASLKPLWDGLQDSRVLGDDRHLTHLPPRFEVDRERPRLVVEIFDVELDFKIEE